MTTPPTCQEQPACPRCGSTEIVRNGHSHSRRRLLCHGCKRSFGPTTVVTAEGVRLPEQHAAFLELCRTPLPLRTAAKQVSVSLSTAFRWRHAFLQRLEEEEQSHSADLSGRVAVACSNVCANEPRQASGSTERVAPAIARFPALTAWNTRVATITHLVECQNGQVTQQFSHYSQDHPERSGLGAIVAQHVLPGTEFQSQYGQGIVIESRSWPFGPSFHNGPTPIKWQLGTRARGSAGDSRCEAEKEEAFLSRRAATRLRLAFRRWMRAFRGIAVRHIGRYTAWFNTCWRHAQETLTDKFLVWPTAGSEAASSPG